MASIVYQVQTLVTQVRTESDLNLSQAFTDTDLATVISDAGSSLRDIFTGTNQYYDISTFDFTLAGGLGANTVTLPQDFQQGHSIDVNPGTNQPFTLRYLPNWLNRNSYNLPFQVFGNNFGPKAYTFLGNEIVVLPAQYSAGVYRLYYTPTWTPLMIPQGPPPDLSGIAPTFAGISPGGIYGFTHTNWTAQNIGDTVTISGCSNSQNNGTFTVLSVTPNSITTTNAASVSEAGATQVLVDQQFGTTPTLPQNMNPWIQYIKTQAIITVRTKRGQPVDSFEARLQIEKDRIQVILQDRKEEPNQPPLLRGNYDGWGDDICGDGGLW